MTTPEQQAREMLGRMKVEHADYYSAGDLIELANLIAERDALKAELVAIKQGTVEPVAWGQLGTMNGKTYLRGNWDRRPYPPPLSLIKSLALVPLYTRPCVPLTNEQIWSLAGPHITYYQFGEATHRDINCLELARALEAAHNIKGAKP